jgi:hypothetical protein
MNQMLLGAIALASLLISLFFLRFWKVTGDRFFLFFACSFSIEGINRIILGLASSTETEPYIYFVRFLSFVLILIAIIDKNRKRTPPAADHGKPQS